MSSLLVIQFRENKQTILAEQKSFDCCFKKYGCEVNFLNALDKNIIWNDAPKIIGKNMGIILGGSGDFDFDGGRYDDDPQKIMSYRLLSTMEQFFNYLFDNNTPTLGICYGHQILGAFKGVPIINNKEQSKMGSYEVSIAPQYVSDPFFKGIPSFFIAQYGHKDSLSALPRGAEVIARGAHCDFGALKYSSRIYSVQFHPELTVDDMRERLEKNQGYLPEREKIKSVLVPSTYSELILRNFVNIASCI